MVKVGVTNQHYVGAIDNLVNDSLIWRRDGVPDHFAERKAGEIWIDPQGLALVIEAKPGGANPRQRQSRGQAWRG